MVDTQAVSRSNSGNGFFQGMLITELETIPQLTEENHSIWKDKITALLKLRGVLKAMDNPNIPLGESDNAELVMLLLSKMDSVTHNNVVMAENRDLAQRIWLSIKERFASSQSSNHATMFNDFLYAKYHDQEISRGRDQASTRQIMHSDKELDVEFVCNHLIQFNNESKAHLEKRELPLKQCYCLQKINHLERDKEAIKTTVKPIPLRDVAADITIQRKTRTTAVTTAGICIPKALQIGGKEKPKENYFMSLLTRWIESGDPKHRIILDSGASVSEIQIRTLLVKANRFHIKTWPRKSPLQNFHFKTRISQLAPICPHPPLRNYLAPNSPF
ncbi:hypothetical protein VP01_1659g4 [Puccinia sorghi]|uniref:Uncharacterized protein n=1 Tax=Puccinia sorghi TaxID=27349 RepID=A0A0L6VGD6_9BASI|nr:hypothetical protein VP01_1659g4 [Puccinia sorghi]